MELRSGSSPAVVSTIHAGWRRDAPAAPVIRSHSRRFGCACSSSKITQLGFGPCLPAVSAESTCKIPSVIHFQPPLPVFTRRRYSMILRLSTMFSSPRAIIFAVHGALVAMNTAAR